MGHPFPLFYLSLHNPGCSLTNNANNKMNDFMCYKLTHILRMHTDVSFSELAVQQIKHKIKQNSDTYRAVLSKTDEEKGGIRYI